MGETTPRQPGTPNNWQGSRRTSFGCAMASGADEPSEKRKGKSFDNVPPSRAAFYDALVIAIGRHRRGDRVARRPRFGMDFAGCRGARCGDGTSRHETARSEVHP